MHDQLLGTILAGGAGRRMGQDKANVIIGGSTMLEAVADALRPVVARTIVVGREHAPGFEALPDLRPSRRGPLAGLATALTHGAGDAVLLVAVDQPYLRTATVARLAGLAEPERAIVPIDDGARQVTCAVYPAAWAGEADAEDAAGGSIQSLLDRMPIRAVPPHEWRDWGEDGRSWLSLDDEAAITAARERFGDPR